MLLIEEKDDVVILKLNHAITNAINKKLIESILEKLKILKENQRVIGIVLTSSNNKFFSIGFNIPELLEMDRKNFTTFYHLFNQVCMDLYTFPKPTIAAIGGHAIAGGCILALNCDYRFISQGRKLMGLNEIKLGVPVPYPASCMLRELVGTRIARDMTYSGDFYTPEQLLKMGVIDRVLLENKLIEVAIEEIKNINSTFLEAFSAIKKNRISNVEKLIEENLLENENIFIENWYSEQAQISLKKAVEKF